MTDLDVKEERLLAAARRALSPSDNDRLRVQVRLGAALRAGIEPAPQEPTSSVSAPDLVRWAARIGLAVLIGGAGYLAGHRVGFLEGSRSSSPILSTAGRGEAGVLGRPRRAGTDTTAQIEPSIAAAVASGSVRAKESVAVVGAASTSATRSAPAASAGDDLEREVRALRRVERAQRAGNPRLALALLDELDQEVPRARLAEERTAARAMAECLSTFGAPRAELAARFRKRYGASVYLLRVETACRETDSAPSGDSRLERQSTQ